ncbi:MAG TPA: hypothetical protein VFW76_00515 [Ktedonobacterales bacterium]|nr:hypothetical protein [Ktedonobacterales bacterium]
MGNHNPEQDDDLQIEVSSLQPSSATSEPSAEPSTAQPLFAPRRSRLAQRWRGVVVIAVLVVALTALTLTIAPTRGALFGARLARRPLPLCLCVLVRTTSMSRSAPIGEP